MRIIAAFCLITQEQQNNNSFHYVIAVEITIVYNFNATTPREIHQIVFTIIVERSVRPGPLHRVVRALSPPRHQMVRGGPPYILTSRGRGPTAVYIGKS